MELNKMISTYHSRLIWAVVFFVLMASLLNNWSIEAVVMSTIFGTIIILTISLIKRYGFLTDNRDKIRPINSGEDSIIVEGKAERISDKIKTEGVLYLTKFNLVFESAGKESWKLCLKDIGNVQLFTMYGIFKLGITIDYDSHAREHFILKYPGDWKQIISFYMEEYSLEA